MKKISTLKTELESWLEENKHHLSIRYSTASVNLRLIDDQQLPNITLGKYNSEPQYPKQFYKPISKIINMSILNE